MGDPDGDREFPTFIGAAASHGSRGSVVEADEAAALGGGLAEPPGDAVVHVLEPGGFAGVFIDSVAGGEDGGLV